MVNGCPGLLHSLVLDADAGVDEERLKAGEDAGYDGDNPVTLSKPPHAVNMIVGSTDEKPRFWHEQELDDISRYIPMDFFGGEEQSVPLVTSNEVVDADTVSRFAYSISM